MEATHVRADGTCFAHSLRVDDHMFRGKRALSTLDQDSDLSKHMRGGDRAKIVFIHPSDELYGADRILLELVALVPDTVQVEVWLPTDLVHSAKPLCTELESRSVPVRHFDLPILRRAYRRPRDILRLLARTVTTARRLRANRPDIVYCTASSAYLGVLSARLAGVSSAVGHVQEFWWRTDKLVLTPLAAMARQLIAISPAVADALPARLRSRTTVVTNATSDPGATTPLAQRSGPIRYLVASRWNGWKGHRTLLAAWDRAGCPGELVVLGAMPPSGEAVDVAELARALTRPETVDIVGEVDDIAAYIESADVVVMPSDQPEPFGLVAIEAFAAGRPVVASDAGGLHDIITAGRDGWLYPPRDHIALAAVIESLRRPAVTAAGEQARRTFQERYTLDRFARDWCGAMALPMPPATGSTAAPTAHLRR